MLCSLSMTLLDKIWYQLELTLLCSMMPEAAKKLTYVSKVQFRFHTQFMPQAFIVAQIIGEFGSDMSYMMLIIIQNLFK